MTDGPELLFVDTEFTSLGEPWPVQLVSIGVCDIHGVPLYYSEVDDFNMWYASFFTQEYVLPHCDGGTVAMSYQRVCATFFEYFNQRKGPFILVADSEWDGLWLQMMCKGQQNMDGFTACLNAQDLVHWPTSVLTTMEVLELEYLNGADIELCSQQRVPFLREHHALDDAIGLAQCVKTLLLKYQCPYTLSHLRRVFTSHAMKLD